MVVVFLALASFLPLSTGAPSAQLKGFFLSSGWKRTKQLFKSGTHTQTPALLLTVGFYRQVTEPL